MNLNPGSLNDRYEFKRYDWTINYKPQPTNYQLPLAISFIESSLHLQYLFFDRFLRSNDGLDKERRHYIHDSIDWICNGIYTQSFAGGLLPANLHYFEKEVESRSLVAGHRQYFIFSDSNFIHPLFK